MAKQDRTYLARGVKLLVEHVKNPFVSAETDLSTAAGLIPNDQRQERFGYVRVHFSIPAMNSVLYPHVVGVFGDIPFELPLPFALPPLQEFLNESSPGSGISDGLLAADTPELDLMAVSVGLDQRDEPAAIADHANLDSGGGASVGQLDYTRTDAYRCKMSLMQKKMFCFGAEEPWDPDVEVWSGEVAAINWSRRYVDRNPVPWVMIEQGVNPMKSFLLNVSLPALNQPLAPGLEVRTYAAVSLNIQLVFRHPLVARDAGLSIQNLPVHHLGNKVPRTPQLTGAVVPSGDDDLKADGTKGLQTMAKVMDAMFQRRLRSGYYPDGARDEKEEHLLNDASYHVEMFPFFNNYDSTRIITPANAGTLPYVSQVLGNTQDPVVHRHVQPLSTPMTIHHVIAAVQYANPPNGTHPGGLDFVNQIGVAIGTGFPRGDAFEYRQVAYRSWPAASKSVVTLDRIKARPGGLLSADVTEPWDVELIDVPLVQRAVGHEGIGLLSQQGPPFYVGKSSSLMSTRTPVGGVAPGDNTSDINETFLEVRWLLKNDAVGGLAGMPGTDALVGYGGHWLILIGKKHVLPPGGVRT